jgi:hypothetical protein
LPSFGVGDGHDYQAGEQLAGGIMLVMAQPSNDLLDVDRGRAWDVAGGA